MFPDIPEDYILIGGRGDRPIESPIIIDLRLEIIDLRRRLSETRFILQAASPNFDSSQALNELVNGILKHEFGVVSIATPGTDYLAPILPYQNIWIGDIANTPQPNPRIFVNNLPHMGSADPTLLFGAYNLYSGSPNPLTLGEPQIIKTLHITNMADLPVGHLWLGQVSLDPLNLGLNRPVPIIVLPLANMADLPEGMIWRGDTNDRPVPSDDLTNLEIEVGDINIDIESIFDHLAEIDVHLGDIDIHLGDIDTHLGDIDTHLEEIDIHLGDIDTEITEINVNIDNIFDSIASIQADITSIFEAITNINVQLGDIVLRLDGIDISLADIVVRLDGIDLTIETNLDSGLAHLADLQLQIDAGISSGMDHLATINASIDAINLALTELSGDITTINTTIIDIQTDITTINSTIVDIQTDITTIQTDITTINTSITDILAAIVIIEDSIGDGSVTLTGAVTGTGQVGESIATTLTVPLNLVPAPTGNVNFSGFKATNLQDPLLSQDGTTKTYVDSADFFILSRTLDQIPVATGTVNLNFQALNNVLSLNLESTAGINFSGAVPAGLTNYISFPNTAQVKRLILWNDPLAPNNFEFSGLGTDSSASILYHANIGASHLFYAGLTSSTKKLIAEFNPSIGLQFPNVVSECKICLWQTAANSFQVFGFGLKAGILKYSVGASTNRHAFYCGVTSTTDAELFRIDGSGYSAVSNGTGTIGTGTFYSRVPSAHVQMTGNATTTSCTANVWVKAAGTTAATAGAVQFTTATTNRLTFTGSQLGAACQGMASASATVAVTNLAATRVGLAIYKNGTLIQNAPSYATTNASGSTNSPTLLVVPEVQVSLSPTDYVEAWVLAGNNTVMTVTNLNLSFKAI